MEEFTKKPLFKTVCGLIFIVTLFGIMSMVTTQNSALKIDTLNTFGDYFGGILGPLLSFITIIILLKDKEDSDKRNKEASALMIYEKLKPVLRAKEDIFVHQGLNIHGQTTNYRGMEVVKYFTNLVDLNILRIDNNEVYEWIESYTSKLKELNSTLSVSKNLQDLFLYEFHEQFTILKKFRDTYNQFDKINMFDDNAMLRVHLKLIDIHLNEIFSKNQYL